MSLNDPKTAESLAYFVESIADGLPADFVILMVGRRRPKSPEALETATAYGPQGRGSARPQPHELVAIEHAALQGLLSKLSPGARAVVIATNGTHIECPVGMVEVIDVPLKNPGSG